MLMKSSKNWKFSFYSKIPLVAISEKLKNIDLEGVIYVYGSKDSRVGRLTQKEITFLESKGVSVFSCNYEHGDTVYGLVEALMKNKIRL